MICTKRELIYKSDLFLKPIKVSNTNFYNVISFVIHPQISERLYPTLWLTDENYPAHSNLYRTIYTTISLRAKRLCNRHFLNNPKTLVYKLRPNSYRQNKKNYLRIRVIFFRKFKRFVQQFFNNKFVFSLAPSLILNFFLNGN